MSMMTPEDRWNWMGAALCGAIASAPFTVAVIGWAQSWNVYTNLSLMLGSSVLWLALWRAWS